MDSTSVVYLIKTWISIETSITKNQISTNKLGCIYTILWGTNKYRSMYTAEGLGWFKIFFRLNVGLILVKTYTVPCFVTEDLLGQKKCRNFLVWPRRGVILLYLWSPQIMRFLTISSIFHYHTYFPLVTV